MTVEERLSLQELSVLDNWKKAVIVFKQESFNEEYSEKSRSYEVNSDAKYFNPKMSGTSLFANCLDGTDQSVRLDFYIQNDWIVDYCYITKKEKPTDGNQ